MTLPSASEIRARAEALPAVTALLRTLGREQTQPVFLVGGAVRDLLLGREPLDLDLAVEGPLGELTQRLDGTPEIHDRFGTATVSGEGVRYDIAQTRAERYPTPGALPEVRPAPITEDIKRRDFTVNALALALTGPQAGELLKVDGSTTDLQAGRMAVLHDQSFSDDPTRLLRLVRYAARLGFSIAPHTRKLAEAAIAAGALQTVSGTRVGNELRLLATESDPLAAFALLAELGLDHAIDASLSIDAERRELASKALEQLPPDGRPDLLVLGVALLGGKRKATAALLERLEFTAADAGVIVGAATRAPEICRALARAETGSQIARAVAKAGVATVALAAALGAPAPAERWLTELRHRELGISGDDLIAAGIPEGAELGRRLSRARDAMWDGTAPDRESQLASALAAG